MMTLPCSKQLGRTGSNHAMDFDAGVLAVMLAKWPSRTAVAGLTMFANQSTMADRSNSNRWITLDPNIKQHRAAEPAKSVYNWPVAAIAHSGSRTIRIDVLSAQPFTRFKELKRHV